MYEYIKFEDDANRLELSRGLRESDTLGAAISLYEYSVNLLENLRVANEGVPSEKTSAQISYVEQLVHDDYMCVSKLIRGGENTFNLSEDNKAIFENAINFYANKGLSYGFNEPKPNIETYDDLKLVFNDLHTHTEVIPFYGQGFIKEFLSV